MKSTKDEGIVPISIPLLLVSTTPLILIILASWRMELDLESSIISSTIRTFIQLSILASILRPIFMMENVFLVLGYCLIMILLAATITCRKTKYVFMGQYYTVLGSILVSVACTGLFAFVVVIRPRPVWNPQYVIPMVGMLLGNSVNGISITMNSLCIALVEQQREIELYLSFGATGYEAVSRLLREAVRSGTTPLLNSMAVIGIISIPGMMTGQILGGSPVMEAARYQMLIMYLIAISTFGAILMEVWVILDIGFDSSHILRSERFDKAPDSQSFVELASNALFATLLFKRYRTEHHKSEMEMDPLRSCSVNQAYYTPESSRLEVQPLKEILDSSIDEYNSSPDNVLVLDGLTKLLTVKDNNDADGIMESNCTQILFNELSFKVGSGDISLIRGPSGCGKSQLLRSIAGLSPLDKGTISLDGIRLQAFDSPSDWRKRVRYVTQYKVDIPGSPRDFVRRIVTFKSWQKDGWPTEQAMLKLTIELVEKWGLQESCLDKEWSVLSGGEAQRVIVALSIASKPSVLLLDESTSALDVDSKIAVERTIDDLTEKNGLKIIWVSHDPDILRRYE